MPMVYNVLFQDIILTNYKLFTQKRKTGITTLKNYYKLNKMDMLSIAGRNKYIIHKK